MLYKKLLLILILCPILSFGQISHYFSLNTGLYANFFNKEKDKIASPNFKLVNEIPRFSYKAELERHGIEFYFSYFLTNYHELNIEDAKEGDIITRNTAILGLNYQYRFLSTKYFAINSIVGVNYGWHRGDILDSWYCNGFCEPFFSTESGDEASFGFQTGANLNIPVWRNIYFNNNWRLTVLPFVEKKLLSKNLMVEIGIGYKFYRKSK